MAKKKAEEKPKASALRKKIYQSNPLLQARKGMSTLELRIFFLGLRGINPHLSTEDKLFDSEFKEVFIPTASLTKIFNGNTRYLHDLDKICNKLFDAKIFLRYEDGGFVLMHVFQKLEYVHREGLYIRFDELMRPYLLDLFKSRGFTQIDVEQIFQLTSPYAIRLVELMLQYQNMPDMKKRGVIERTMALDELRFSLDVADGAYASRMNNFRKFVLDVPILEINEKTSYKMSYEVLKQGGTGGRVYAFKFFLDTSALPHEEPITTENSSAIEKLKSLGFGEQAARAIRAKCADDADCLKRITSATRSLSMKKKRTDVENELGYLRKHIEEGWTQKSKVHTEPAPQPKPKAKLKPKSKPKVQPAPVRTATSAEPIGRVLRGIFPPLKLENETPPDGKLPDIPRSPKPVMRKPALEEFRTGEQPIADSLVEAIAEDVMNGSLKKSTSILLNFRGLTVERFKKLYME